LDAAGTGYGEIYSLGAFNAEAIMRKISIVLSVLSLTAAVIGARIAPASADVVVNNILSPFTVIQVGPGHRAYGYRPPAWWINDPRHHQRCYRRWDGYYGEWRFHCVRMHPWGGESYWD